VVIFRERTEDVYSGIEWPQGSPGARKILQVVGELERILPEDSGIGIKHVSRSESRRLVRKAISYALQHELTDVTIVHQGNVMKYTEGAFREWGYELARDEFGDCTVTELDLWNFHNGGVPNGKILLKDRLADLMFQQLLLRPAEFQVLATLSLNGDYLADFLAAQVGGLGMAPASTEGDGVALFEATHGTAPKYAGQDKVNPGSLLLSGVMMLRWLGWDEAAASIELALERTILQRRVTYDLGRQIDGATIVTTSGFAEAIVENLE
jgi:isocitrate dehydrogenase